MHNKRTFAIFGHVIEVLVLANLCISTYNYSHIIRSRVSIAYSSDITVINNFCKNIMKNLRINLAESIYQLTSILKDHF